MTWLSPLAASVGHQYSRVRALAEESFLTLADAGALDCEQSVFTHLVTVTFSLTNSVSTFGFKVFIATVEDQKTI